MRVTSRELRNDTAGVLRRAAAGETVEITVNGEPVAELVERAARTGRPRRCSSSGWRRPRRTRRSGPTCAPSPAIPTNSGRSGEPRPARHQSLHHPARGEGSTPPISSAVADEWAKLRLLLAEAGRRVNVNDTWIAATALAHDVPVVSQDDDYGVLAEISTLRVIAV